MTTVKKNYSSLDNLLYKLFNAYESMLCKKAHKNKKTNLILPVSSNYLYFSIPLKRLGSMLVRLLYKQRVAELWLARPHTLKPSPRVGCT